jgi:hypothetical protein
MELLDQRHRDRQPGVRVRVGQRAVLHDPGGRGLLQRRRNLQRQRRLRGPPFACDAAGKASLAIDAAKGKAAFGWQRASIAMAELGDPTDATQHTLCISDAEGTVLALETPAGPLWKATGKPGSETGFVYKDKTGANDGVRSLALKAHDGDKAKIALSAKGEALPVPALGTGLTAPVTARLPSSGGACWEASFVADDLKKNDASRVKATSAAAPQ